MQCEAIPSLSLIEKKVISHLIEGKTRKETSLEVATCIQNIDKIIRNTKDKFDCKSTAQLAYFLTKNNLI